MYTCSSYYNFSSYKAYCHTINRFSTKVRIGADSSVSTSVAGAADTQLYEEIRDHTPSSHNVAVPATSPTPGLVVPRSRHVDYQFTQNEAYGMTK